MAELIALSSDSDSDDEMDTLILLHLTSKRQKSVWKCEYMKKRKTHGEFVLTPEFSDKQFTNYFRLNRSQFNEVHGLVQNSIYSEGCNAQKLIGTEEKLAVFLRQVVLFFIFKLLIKTLQCYLISSILSRTFVTILVYLKIGCGLDSMALIYAKFYLSIIMHVGRSYV
jgi:hypothetical protein